jgi:sugar lactone lactonase YvrE
MVLILNTIFPAALAADGQFNTPFGVATDSSSNVYVADSGNNRIQKFKNDGTFIRKWGTEGTADGQFKFPTNVAIGSSGNVYVVDSGNNCIQKFKNSGTFIRTWGTFATVNQTQASSINPFGESKTNSFQAFGDNTGMSTVLSKLNEH